MLNHISRVILVPRNGYINRLQAIASSQLLAQELNATFQVCWMSEPAAPLEPSEIFPVSFLRSYFCDLNEMEAELGIPLLEFAPHLRRRGSIISLAGDLLGEQHFMPELSLMIDSLTEQTTIVIRGGGNFSLSHSPSWIERSRWYKSFVFNPEIEQEARNACGRHEPYLGLHLRYTDRSHETPTRAQIRKALFKLIESTGIHTVFIASDSRSQLNRWTEILNNAGVKSWSYEPALTTGSVENRGVDALIDWRILTKAEALVFFAASSFGSEAAVATGHFKKSIALAPSQRIRIWNRVIELGRSLYRYPKNHGWIS
jgi:hypothetical protein